MIRSSARRSTAASAASNSLDTFLKTAALFMEMQKVWEQILLGVETEFVLLVLQLFSTPVAEGVGRAKGCCGLYWRLWSVVGCSRTPAI